MSQQTDKPIEERVKTLETLQRNARVAIIILVGYSIYDVISRDSGSDIIFAHKVKATQFDLVDGQSLVYGSWKILDKDTQETGIVIENAHGQQVRITADSVTLSEGGVNPYTRVKLDEDGLQLLNTPSEELIENESSAQ
ncbi:MAG: hypothetical protein AAF372_04345 [Pseudomonadota bacterium]